MGVPVIHAGPMTVAEFYSFTDRRPDEEKWELIDGQPVLNAAPSRIHQTIIKNVLFVLTTCERRAAGLSSGVSWEVLPDLGIRVSDTRRPEPDIVIIPRAGGSPDPRERDRSDVIVAFEVLSPSTEGRDLRWKRAAYTSLASLTHYVVIAQDAVEVVVFARDDSFAEWRIRSIDAAIELGPLGITLPMAEIYRDTGIDPVAA